MIKQMHVGKNQICLHIFKLYNLSIHSNMKKIITLPALPPPQTLTTYQYLKCISIHILLDINNYNIYPTLHIIIQ